MPFWTATPEEAALQLITDGMSAKPGMADRFEAIADLREASRQDLTPTVGEVARADGFLRVASLQGPLADLALVLDPMWLQDKKRFYKWLDANKKFATYDRNRSFKNSDITFSNGKAV